MKSKALGWLLLIGGSILGLILLLVGVPGKATPTLEKFIAYLARFRNPYLSVDDAAKIAQSVIKWVKRRNLDIFSVLAIIDQESTFDPRAKGRHGERGLMQLSDLALAELERVYSVRFDKTRLFEIDHNIQAGTLFYLHCLDLAKGKRREAIARYHRTTNWQSALDYADRVMEKREEIENLYYLFNKFIKEEVKV